MKEINAVKYFAGAALAVAISSAAVAEPTRGFTIEHGTLAEKGSVSIDVQRNLNNTQAGLRAGFEKFEVILNSGQLDTTGLAGTTAGTDALVKVGLPALEGLSELDHGWAVIGGVSMYDQDDGNDYFNLTAGVAFTAAVDSLSFTVTPALVVNDARDETYLNIGAGAYYSFGETEYGTFKPGVEVQVSTLSDIDTILNLGVRWGINERVNVDLVPFQVGGTDTLSIPGQIRVNAAF